MKPLTSERRSDLPLLRLRAFEFDWVLPMVEVPDGLIDQMLITEAGWWIRAGQSFGYFADAPLLHDAVALPGLGERSVHDFLGVEDFVHCLEEAIEDLTPERRIFLGIILASEDAVFQERLARLDSVIMAISTTPDVQLPADVVDDAAWGLTGAVSMLDGWYPTHPATWRSSNDALARTDANAGKRLAELEHVRRKLLESPIGRFSREGFAGEKPVPVKSLFMKPIEYGNKQDVRTEFLEPRVEPKAAKLEG